MKSVRFKPQDLQEVHLYTIKSGCGTSLSLRSFSLLKGKSDINLNSPSDFSLFVFSKSFPLILPVGIFLWVLLRILCWVFLPCFMFKDVFNNLLWLTNFRNWRFLGYLRRLLDPTLHSYVSYNVPPILLTHCLFKRTPVSELYNSKNSSTVSNLHNT